VLVLFLTDDRLVDRRRIKECEGSSTEMYTNELHEALLRKHNTDFWKGWRSKFESVNECKQVEGCVDADVIVGKFFIKSYACNNALRADELRQRICSVAADETR